MDAENLQDRYAPEGRCFGCGAANPKGLRIKSRVEGDEVVADFRPEPWQEAFEGVLSGGIIGTLLDCHMNWTAAYAIMKKRGADKVPSTVTARYEVDLKRPTPTAGTIHLRARAEEVSDGRATVSATVSAEGRVTASGRGTFVAVEEGHPAFGRW